jgi:hypothetical protein
MEVIDNPGKSAVYDRTVFTVQYHETGPVSRLDGGLSDKLRGESIVKVTCFHEFHQIDTTITIPCRSEKGNVMRNSGIILRQGSRYDEEILCR